MHWGVVVVAALALAAALIYAKRVENYVNGSRTVTLYTVDWCPWCKKMAPIWDRVRTDLAGQVKFVTIENPHPSPVTQYPTIRMIDEFGKQHDYAGPPEFTALRTWILRPVA